jgi:hypothetical protein
LHFNLISIEIRHITERFGSEYMVSLDPRPPISNPNYRANRKGKDIVTYQLNIDGHPRYIDSTWPEYVWPATKCNEDSADTLFNARLIFVEKRTKIPTYPNIDRKNTLFVVLLRDLKPDEEILLDYGWTRRTYHSLGYIPHRFTSTNANQADGVPIVKKRSDCQSEITRNLLMYKKKKRRKMYNCCAPKKKRLSIQI